MNDATEYSEILDALNDGSFKLAEALAGPQGRRLERERLVTFTRITEILREVEHVTEGLAWADTWPGPVEPEEPDFDIDFETTKAELRYERNELGRDFRN